MVFVIGVAVRSRKARELTRIERVNWLMVIDRIPERLWRRQEDNHETHVGQYFVVYGAILVVCREILMAAN